MKTTFVRFAAVAALALVSLSSQATVDTYRAHGSVVAVDTASNKITLKQDAVSELGWPARTMTYTADGSTVLNNVAVGKTVDAVFTASNPYQASVHFVTPVSQ
jgi:Cu/Ag efflux protein CusF